MNNNNISDAHLCRRVKLAGLRHTLTEEQVAALARAAHGFVGADIAALCSEAAMTALRRCVAAGGALQAFGSPDVPALLRPVSRTRRSVL